MGDVVSMFGQDGQEGGQIELATFAKVFARSAIEEGHIAIDGDDVGVSGKALATFGAVIGQAISLDEAQQAVTDYPRLYIACCVAWLGAVCKIEGGADFLNDMEDVDLSTIH